MTGLVLRRLRAHRLLLGAALLSIVLTTCAVAALAAFGSSIGDAGLRRALQEQSADRTLIEVKSGVGVQDPARMDAAVRKAISGAYDGLPVGVASTTRSGPYGLPLSLRAAGSPRTGDPDLTLLATFDPSRVTLTRGDLPGPASAEGPVPVAVPEAVAAALRLRPGDMITLADRRGGPSLRVRLTGAYRATDPTALYWRLDPLAGRGVRTLAFTTYGPLLTDPRSFSSGAVPAAEMQWQAGGDFSAMTVGRMDDVRRAAEQTVRRLDRLSPGGTVVAESDLPALFEDLRGTLLVSRLTLLISALQLGLLAALALFLVAGLLAAERSGETAWLRARGGSRAHVTGLAATEALLLALPAVVLAPLLADPLVQLLAAHGALARAGVSLDASDSTAGWVATVAALACAFIVLAPSLRRPGTYAGEQAAATGRHSLPAAARAGGDIGLVVVAALAFWQLSRRGGGSGVLTVDSGGALGLDPVLVVAPALCLLAGAVLTLRLLPLVARLGERRAARGRGLAAALTGWQLSRRPGRGTTPALLLVFAMSISIFALGESTSWTRSQSDQADFAVGSDVRVTGTSTTPFGQGGVYDDVSGITAVMPVNRSEVPLPRDREASVLVMDSSAAGEVMRLREDLADRPVADLVRPLRPKGASGPDAGFVLPEGAARLRLVVSLEVVGAHGRSATSTVTDRISATFTDRYGAPYTFALGEVPADGRRYVLEADFAAEAGRAAGSGPAGPLRLSGLKADYLVPRRAEHHRLSLTTLTVVTAGGVTEAVSVPNGTAWSARTRIEAPDFEEDPADGYRNSRAETPRSDSDTPLTVRYDTGAEPFQDYVQGGSHGAMVSVRAGTPFRSEVPALVTGAFLRAVDARVGDRVSVDVRGVKLTVRVAGTLRALPTTRAVSPDSDGGAILLDLRTVNRALAGLDQNGLQPGEWWIATDPHAGPRVASVLRARGDITSVLVRDEQRDELRSDPLGAGPLSALPAAVVTASLLAAVGFAATAVGAMRERAQEMAILAALGAPRRSLARVAAAEQGLLVLVAVTVGAVLGGLLTRLVVPLIVLTTGADNPVPAVRVELPAGSLVGLLVIVAVVPLLVIAVTALRSVDPVQALRRQGGE